MCAIPQLVSALLNPLYKHHLIHYINTNEIPGDLSRENIISSHLTKTYYLTREKIAVAMVV